MNSADQASCPAGFIKEVSHGKKTGRFIGWSCFCSDDTGIYNARIHLASDAVKERGYNSGQKKIYYISAEFLIGKAAEQQPDQSWAL